MNPEKVLTARQKESLDAFRAIVKRNRGVSPSLEEIAAELGVKKATAQDFVRQLLKKGYIVRNTGSYRSLSVAPRSAR